MRAPGRSTVIPLYHRPLMPASAAAQKLRKLAMVRQRRAHAECYSVGSTTAKTLVRDGQARRVQSELRIRSFVSTHALPPRRSVVRCRLLHSTRWACRLCSARPARAADGDAASVQVRPANGACQCRGVPTEPFCTSVPSTALPVPARPPACRRRPLSIVSFDLEL